MTARSTRRAPCPQCNKGPSDRALAYYGDHVHCFRCGYRRYDDRPCSSCGEMFEPRAASHDRCDECFGARGFLPGNGASKEPLKNGSDEEPFSLDRLNAIWSRTVPLRGTVGETYLRHRRCALPPPDSDLRFLPGSDRYPPSLCGLVTDAMTGEPMTLHFTRLRSDGLGKAGTDRDKLLLKGHRKAGGAIRLWSDESVSTGLAIAEGIETALCAAHAFTPVWSCIDAGNLAKFPVLPGVEALTIFADNDPAGLKAAHECGRRWAEAGREVRVVIPDFGDVADAVAA